MFKIDRRLVLTILLILVGYTGLLLALVYMEQQSTASGIDSIWDAAWFSVVTFTTVGYDDLDPQTALGRVLGILFVIGSLGLTAALIGNFVVYLTEMQRQHKIGHDGTDFDNHVVIVGWSPFAKNVTEQPIAAGWQVTIITEHQDQVDLIHEHFDDAPVFVVFTDLENVERFDKADLRETFLTAGATHVLFRDGIAAKPTASYIFEPDVAEFSTDLLGSSGVQEDYDIRQYYVRDDHRYNGTAYGDVMDDLQEKYECLPIGTHKGNGAQSGDDGELLKLPPRGTRVEAGDYVLLILDGSRGSDLRERFGVEEGI